MNQVKPNTPQIYRMCNKILIACVVIYMLTIAMLYLHIISKSSMNVEGFSGPNKPYISVLHIEPGIDVLVTEHTSSNNTGCIPKILIDAWAGLGPYGLYIREETDTSTDRKEDIQLYFRDILSASIDVDGDAFSLVSIVPYSTNALLIFGPSNAPPTMAEVIRLGGIVYATSHESTIALSALGKVIGEPLLGSIGQTLKKTEMSNVQSIINGAHGNLVCVAIWACPQSRLIQDSLGKTPMRCLTYTSHDHAQKLNVVSKVLDISDMDIVNVFPQARIGQGDSNTLERSITIMRSDVGLFYNAKERAKLSKDHIRSFDALITNALRVLVKEFDVDLVLMNNYNDMRGGLILSPMLVQILAEENKRLGLSLSADGMTNVSANGRTDGMADGRTDGMADGMVEGFSEMSVRSDVLPPSRLGKPLLITPRIHVDVRRIPDGNIVVFTDGANTNVIRILMLVTPVTPVTPNTPDMYTIDNVPVQHGDMVVLRNQVQNPKDNGTYFAVRDGPVMKLTSHWIIDLSTKSNNTQQIKMDRDKGILYLWTTGLDVKWYPNAPLIVLLPNSVTISARLHNDDKYTSEGSKPRWIQFHVTSILPLDRERHADVADEYNRFHPKGHCSLDPLAATREVCERIKGARWDTPCLHDEECPYFDYENDRGGCSVVNGTCEVPIGVERVGYKETTGRLITDSTLRPVFPQRYP